MRIDAHQHFWRYHPVQYPWISESMAVIRRDFLPDDLAPCLHACGLNGSIAVQARQTLEETRWLLELAERHSFIRGVVGWLPLMDPQLGARLDEFAAQTQFVGVRHVVQDEPDPAFLDGAAFNAGIRLVAERKLTYDLLIFAHQLPAALRFADRHPDLRIVLDHVAKPRVEGPPPAEWLRGLREMARRGHVSCKFSGVVTEVVDRPWDDELLRPYFSAALEAFGPDRLMFGSDWPVCLTASGYERWHSFVTQCAASLSTDEQAAMFGGAAQRAYCLS